LFYFMISKRLAREVIPFKKNELISDIIGIVFSLLLPIAPAVLVVSPIYSTILASIFGILAFGVGFVWMIAYYLAIKVRELPDIPEDSESANTSEDSESANTSEDS